MLLYEVLPNATMLKFKHIKTPCAPTVERLF